MNKTPKFQQGFTFLTLIFILGILGFFVLLILKIGPIYMDHSKVKSAFKSVELSTNLPNKSEFEIRSAISKHFDMNYVSRANVDDIKIIKRGNYVKVDLEYEVVEKIFGNLSVLVDFHDSFEAGQES